MNDEHLDNLFAAAREAPIDTASLELGFETRLLARMRTERTAVAAWFVWSRRLAPVFAAVVLVLGVWEALTPGDPFWGLATDLGAETALVEILTGEQK
ncbi:MAG: hypothetical protein N3B01_03680 [Verrucomicrobiae bacterium]|nr:hypothetical protein [Verrucomicrobiae bacterium]